MVSYKDVVKGSRVKLANGWEADVMDNRVNGITRMCNVFGFFTEMGSVYTNDIRMIMVDGAWQHVTHSRPTVAKIQRRVATPTAKPKSILLK